MKKNVFWVLLVMLLVFSFNGCGDETEITYTVTFNSNGGSNVPSISGIKSGATIELPVNPIKIGFIFSGWFIDNETFINQFISSTKITSDITVYAKWINETPNELIGIWNGIQSPILDTNNSIFLEISNRIIKSSFTFTNNSIKFTVDEEFTIEEDSFTLSDLSFILINNDLQDNYNNARNPDGTFPSNVNFYPKANYPTGYIITANTVTTIGYYSLLLDEGFSLLNDHMGSNFYEKE